jgi:hypothetical protein
MLKLRQATATVLTAAILVGGLAASGVAHANASSASRGWTVRDAESALKRNYHGFDPVAWQKAANRLSDDWITGDRVAIQRDHDQLNASKRATRARWAHCHGYGQHRAALYTRFACLVRASSLITRYTRLISVSISVTGSRSFSILSDAGGKALPDPVPPPGSACSSCSRWNLKTPWHPKNELYACEGIDPAPCAATASDKAFATTAELVRYISTQLNLKYGGGTFGWSDAVSCAPALQLASCHGYEFVPAADGNGTPHAPLYGTITIVWKLSHGAYDVAGVDLPRPGCVAGPIDQLSGCPADTTLKLGHFAGSTSAGLNQVSLDARYNPNLHDELWMDGQVPAYAPCPDGRKYLHGLSVGAPVRFANGDWTFHYSRTGSEQIDATYSPARNSWSGTFQYIDKSTSQTCDSGSQTFTAS